MKSDFVDPHMHTGPTSTLALLSGFVLRNYKIYDGGGVTYFALKSPIIYIQLSMMSEMKAGGFFLNPVPHLVCLGNNRCLKFKLLAKILFLSEIECQSNVKMTFKQPLLH